MPSGNVRRARRCRVSTSGLRRRIRAGTLTAKAPLTPHLVLLGDSTFDNAAYTGGEPEVTSHLQRILPVPWNATRVVVDGATTASIASQVRQIPHEATHLAISVGGNDALGHFGLLSSTFYGR